MSKTTLLLILLVTSVIFVFPAYAQDANDTVVDSNEIAIDSNEPLDNYEFMEDSKNTPTDVDEGEKSSFWENFPFEVHGFYEIRAGYRTQNDEFEKDMSIMEQRFQLDVASYLDWAELRFKGDVLGDLVTERAEFDLREAYILTTPADFMDLKVGRQILTWGTGDLVFINDLFPKDWQSFFIGRDIEYLKAPSDAAKASFFSELANLDFVFTPQFDSDRFITGERISFYNPLLGRVSGMDDPLAVDKPDRWFRDYEIAARLYRNISSYEFAAYGYWGYWKSPGGFNNRGEAIFPRLNVYGASLLGNVGKGIGNVEVGLYQSLDDQGGTNPMINNSEFRYLAGYKQEIAKNLTGGIQYYVEQMLNYGAYVDNQTSDPVRDRARHVVTFRLTKLMMNQNLILSFFTYYSPNEKDAYLRPHINYKATDNLGLEAGANIFLGERQDTFFGQFQDNSNIYTAVRYNF